MIKIYHNPRCSKSREGLAILTESGKEFEVVHYLKDVPSEAELKSILRILEIPALQLVRKNEPIWKKRYQGKSLSEADIISALVQNPKLLERPIVIRNNKGTIGRPPEKIKALIQ